MQTPAAHYYQMDVRTVLPLQEGLEAEATRMTGCRKPVSFTVISMDIQKLFTQRNEKISSSLANYMGTLSKGQDTISQDLDAVNAV